MFTPWRKAAHQTGILTVGILSCLKHYAFGDLFVSAAHSILTEMQISKRGDLQTEWTKAAYVY